jgi:hypothetical protein
LNWAGTQVRLIPTDEKSLWTNLKKGDAGINTQLKPVKKMTLSRYKKAGT